MHSKFDNFFPLIRGVRIQDIFNSTKKYLFLNGFIFQLGWDPKIGVSYAIRNRLFLRKWKRSRKNYEVGMKIKARYSTKIFKYYIIHLEVSFYRIMLNFNEKRTNF